MISLLKFNFKTPLKSYRFTQFRKQSSSFPTIFSGTMLTCWEFQRQRGDNPYSLTACPNTGLTMDSIKVEGPRVPLAKTCLDEDLITVNQGFSHGPNLVFPNIQLDSWESKVPPPQSYPPQINKALIWPY